MLKEYSKRLAVCLSGLALYAFGNFWGVLAGSAGTNGWNTMALGMAKATGLTFGTSALIIGAAILVIDYIGKGKLGIGTILNVFLVSILSDVFIESLTFIPAPPNIAVGVAYTLLGQVILAFATVLYMSAGLGAGPRDTLMVITGKSFPKIPVGTFRFFLEMFALVSGVLMGADFGIGTVLVIALQASILQLACMVCRFEPRSVENEDLADTWKRIRGR